MSGEEAINKLFSVLEGSDVGWERELLEGGIGVDVGISNSMPPIFIVLGLAPMTKTRYATRTAPMVIPNPRIVSLPDKMRNIKRQVHK